jgi:hypothetical protein
VHTTLTAPPHSVDQGLHCALEKAGGAAEEGAGVGIPTPAGLEVENIEGAEPEPPALLIRPIQLEVRRRASSHRGLHSRGPPVATLTKPHRVGPNRGPTEVQASDGDAQSKIWADSHNRGQPCELRATPDAPRSARRRGCRRWALPSG